MIIKDLTPTKDVKGGNFVPNDSHKGQMMINTNTYVSVGLIMLICGGIYAILGAINSTKSDVNATREDLNRRFDKVELRVASLESSRNTWTATDMFKWAVHLQQANPQIKVPEPEVNTK